MKFAGVDPPAPAVVNVPDQGVQLFDLEKPLPNTGPQVGVRHVA